MTFIPLISMPIKIQHLLRFPQPSQPHIFFPSLAVFVIAYYTIASFYSAPKQKAWILTTISSLCMTLFSLPFLFDYITGGLSVHAIRHTSMSPLAQWANTIFQAYLVS